MKLTLIPLIFLLTSCSTLSYLTVAKYDANEYSLITSIRTSSEVYVGSCSDSVASKNNVDRLFYLSLEFKNYTQYPKKNTDTYKLATNLHDLIAQTAELYSQEETVSQVFCELNIEQIANSAASIQKTVGDKPR